MRLTGVVRRRVAARVLVVVAVVAAVLAFDAGAADSAVTTRTLTPTADAYVESTAPTTRFGTSTKLISDASPVREVFIRFDLSTIAAPIQSAKLRIHVANVTDGSSPNAGTVARVDNNTWTEAAITYNTRPDAWSATVASLGAVNRNTWVEVTVTSAVTAGSVVTLGLRTTNADGAYLDSRESGATAPQLVVTSGAPDSPAATAVAAACNGTLVSSNAGPVAGTSLKEVSGLDQSTTNAGIYWMHNDSGDSARIFAVNAAGATQRVYNLTGATATDWEDISVGPGPSAGVSYIYVADIGDNALSRSQVVVYRVPEPTVTAGAAVSLGGVAALTLKYPDGPHNAEALLIDPITGELLIIEKVNNGGPARVYRAPASLAAGSVTTMSLVATLSLPTGLDHRVSGADVSADGTQLAVRTYVSVHLWNRTTSAPLYAPLATAPCSVPVVGEVQGEAVAFHANGRGYVTLSEGSNPVLHNFTAP